MTQCNSQAVRVFLVCQGSAILEDLDKLPCGPALRPWISLLRGGNGEPTMLRKHWGLVSVHMYRRVAFQCKIQFPQQLVRRATGSL